MKQVKWRARFWVLYEDTNSHKGWERVNEFLKKYNCRIVDGDLQVIACDEKDFVVIMLTCPEVVVKVFS